MNQLLDELEAIPSEIEALLGDFDAQLRRAIYDARMRVDPWLYRFGMRA